MIRSMLYVPASSERFISGAHRRGADAIILDLEDSVAAGEKEKARSGLADAVPGVSRSGARAFVRINSCDELMLGDAEASCRAGAFGLFMPNASDPRTLRDLSKHLDRLEDKIHRRDQTV